MNKTSPANIPIPRNRAMTHRITLLLAAAGIVFLFPGFSSAQAIDENTLFSNTNTMIIDTGRITDASLHPGTSKKGVSTSGTLRSRTTYTMSESWFEGASEQVNSLFQFFEGDFLLDVRLPSGIKSLVAVSLWQTPQGLADSSRPGTTNTYGWTIKEAFVDLAASGSLSFRIGKQVLQWGRSYFWNPVDLVNYEKKNFLDMDRSREGSTGVRTHAAFGSTLNFYTWIDAGDARSGSDLAIAGKIEFVAGGSEFALTAWGKKGFIPVYGLELSSRLLGFDIKGECALSRGSNTPRYTRQGMGVTKEDRSGDWVPQASLTLSRGIDWEIDDRIQIVAELMANGAGYSDNVLADPLRSAAIYLNDAWTPNWLSRWYAALFVSVAKFPDSTMTLQANLMANLVDGSMIVSSGISWQPVNDLTLMPMLYATVGKEGREYTIRGRNLATEFQARIAF